MHYYIVLDINLQEEFCMSSSQREV